MRNFRFQIGDFRLVSAAMNQPRTEAVFAVGGIGRSAAIQSAFDGRQITPLNTATRRGATSSTTMAALFALLLFSAVFASAATQPFVCDTPFELQSDGDLDGDGRRDLIIVDRATGNYRLAYQLAPGTYSWVAARASGIVPASGLGIGKLNSLTFDSLAITGPNANRLNVVDANNSTVAGLPQSVYISSLGPNAVGVIDIGGGGNTTHDDLYVASIYNGVASYRQTLMRNVGTTNRTQISDANTGALREDINAVLVHTNRAPKLALFQRNVSPTADIFAFLDLASVSPVLTNLVATPTTPQPWEYLSAQFVLTNPYTQILFYSPTTNFIYQYQVNEPALGTYGFAFTTIYTLSNSFDRLFALPGTNGTKLLAFWVGGTSATVYNFTGLGAPTAVQQFNADPGEHFTGAGALANNGFMAYSAPLGQNTSSKFKQWNWNGSSYSNSASGDLPRISAYAASGNVMQFQYEPFVTNNPVLLRVNSAGDWSSKPLVTGGPPAISVNRETFLNSTQGLANPALLSLGNAHPAAAFGLANQYSNMISLFSFNAPAGDKVSEVTISPAPGQYATAIKIAFASANPTDSIFFRIGSGAWNTWTGTTTNWLFTNATVQYYGQPLANAAKSAIKSAGYSFSQSASKLDSDGDGVPDYVELAKGLNPTGGSDSDHDGYSDLEELLHNRNPNDITSVPTNFPHLDDQAAFDLSITPLPWDGFSNRVTLSATGTAVRAYNFQGSLYGLNTTTNANNPFTRLTNIAIVAEDRLLSFVSEQHFSILTTNTNKVVGRELIGMIPVPPLVFPAITYVYSGGNITNAATNWILSASNTLNNLPRSVLTNTLSVRKSLASLLVEQKVAQILGARGSNWWTNITLFSYRTSDLGRTNPPQATLLSLEYATTNQPGYKLQTIFSTISNLVENSVSVNIVALRSVVQDIYRISSVQNNTNPATFASPIDEVRYFLWNGTLESNYLFWATSAGQFASARIGGSNILAAVPPRPTTNVVLMVRNDTVGGPCRILDQNGGGATWTLLNSAGLAFSFPDNFQMLPGSLVEISGYTDVTNSTCAYLAIEVTSALLCSVPIATDNDGNGNLLIDTWEQRFFGVNGFTNPFGDADGDGYSNLQEMLGNSDPLDFYGRPGGSAVPFFAPIVSLDESGGLVEIHFTWPAAYIGNFDFGVRHSPAIGSPFSPLAVSLPINVSGNEFKVVFAAPGTPQHFYYLTVALH